MLDLFVLFTWRQFLAATHAGLHSVVFLPHGPVMGLQVYVVTVRLELVFVACFVVRPESHILPIVLCI